MRATELERFLDEVDVRPSQRGRLWRLITRYETLVDVLWRMREHELNIDGSPCWCKTENEPDEHGDDCRFAREAFLGVRSVA